MVITNPSPGRASVKSTPRNHVTHNRNELEWGMDGAIMFRGGEKKKKKKVAAFEKHLDVCAD